MAYARKGFNQSDVHVVLGYDGEYVCIGCELAAPTAATAAELPDVRAETAQDMITHLRQHQQHGHRVPEETLSRLRNGY